MQRCILYSNGLAVATEYVVDDPEELKSPRHYYTDYVTLLKDAEINKVIKPGTPIVYTGKIGNVEYQSKITILLKGNINLNSNIEKMKII